MILKIRTTLLGSNYKYFDYRGELSTYEESRLVSEMPEHDELSTGSSEKGDEKALWFLTHRSDISPSKLSKGEDTKLSQLKLYFKGSDGIKYIITTEFVAFLINEEGKTIDRLHTHEMY
jgi:hypothetical protein